MGQTTKKMICPTKNEETSYPWSFAGPKNLDQPPYLSKDEKKACGSFLQILRRRRDFRLAFWLASWAAWAATSRSSPRSCSSACSPRCWDSYSLWPTESGKQHRPKVNHHKSGGSQMFIHVSVQGKPFWGPVLPTPPSEPPNHAGAHPE